MKTFVCCCIVLLCSSSVLFGQSIAFPKDTVEYYKQIRNQTNKLSIKTESIPDSTSLKLRSLSEFKLSKERINKTKKYKIISIDSLTGFEYSNLPIDSMFDKNNVSIRSKVYDLNDTVVVYRIILKTENMKEKFLVMTRKNKCYIENNKQKIEIGNYYNLDLYNAMGPAPITVDCLDYYGQKFCRSHKDSIFEIYQTTSLEGIYLKR